MQNENKCQNSYINWLNNPVDSVIRMICWGTKVCGLGRNDCVLMSDLRQGSHRVWKTGKTGKQIMVMEKSGKSQGILFWAKSQGKVREFCFKLPIAIKICCYSCRLSRMFVTVFTNMKVHMWIFLGFFVFFIVFKCYISNIKYNTYIIWN